jgi:hypothetical protein
LVRETYNGKHPKRAGAAKKVKKRLKTIANTMLRELDRKMMEAQKAFYKEKMFWLFFQLFFLKKLQPLILKIGG